MKFYKTGSWSDQLWGIKIGRYYATLAGPKWRALYSERHRKGVSVLPLFQGWRVRLRIES